jgi:hypothetical protein
MAFNKVIPPYFFIEFYKLFKYLLLLCFII